jgi:hypothetical protein
MADTLREGKEHVGRRLSSFIYMTIVAGITMAGLYASYLDYVEQRTPVVVLFLGVSLAAGVSAGLALGLVHGTGGAERLP